MTTTTPLTIDVDGTRYLVEPKGEMLGAELWELNRPGHPGHGTAIMFLPTMDASAREAAVIRQVRQARTPASQRIDLAREFAKVDAAALSA